jgi:protein gp37
MLDQTHQPINHHTWNPWRGCTKISPGCQNCYMVRAQERHGDDPYQVMRTAAWDEPLRLQKKAEALGQMDFVCACAWSDWFHEAADRWRDEAWDVIRQCPNLIFQILTKRPERMRDQLPADWGEGYENVWLGVSIELNDYCWRADYLATVPAHLRWICAEPLLGPLPDLSLNGIHWLVAGGECGPDWRPMKKEWVRELRALARSADIPFCFKQGNGLYPCRCLSQIDGTLCQEMPAVRKIALPQFA